MAADAEIVLKFKAEIEEALKQVKALQDALSKLNAEGGFSGEGESEKVAELQAQLSGYVAKVQELQAAYNSLKESGGEANAQALEQIKALSGELEDAQRKINGLVDKILVLQVENNKLKETVKEVGKTTATTTENSVKAYRSLRSIVAQFIGDLARGKVNVKALGSALKGLATSTVILGAIQLAMEGINAATEALTSALGASSKAAEEAAEKAQAALSSAAAEADRAAGEVVKLKAEMRADAENEAIKNALAEQTAAYREQLQAVLDRVQAVKDEAAVEAAQRAMRESAEKHKYAMAKLELDIQLANGEITKEIYETRKRELELQQRQEERARKLADAERKKAREAKAAAELQKAYADAQAQADQAAADRGKYTSDADLKLQEKILEQRRAERDKLSAEVDAAAAELRRLETDFSLDPVKNVEKIVKYNRLSEDVKHMQERLEQSTDVLRKAEATTKAARESNAEYQRISAAMQDAQKNADALKDKTKAAGESANAAARDFALLKASTAQDERQDAAIYSARGRLATAQADKKRRDDADKSANRDAREREKLSAEIEKLTRNAAEAAATSGDLKDDQRAVEAVNSFLDKNAEAVARYGLDVQRLLDVAGQLRDWQTTQGSLVDKLESRLAKLEQDVKSGAQRAKNQAKNS